jgi:hypothetical protein
MERRIEKDNVRRIWVLDSRQREKLGRSLEQ